MAMQARFEEEVAFAVLLRSTVLHFTLPRTRSRSERCLRSLYVINNWSCLIILISEIMIAKTISRSVCFLHHGGPNIKE
jgi:hypothetical protein